jgi:hypothetical protein
MSFEIRSDAVDVEEIMRAIRKRIAEKKQGLYTDEEIREIAERRLQAVLDPHEFSSDLGSELAALRSDWDLRMGPETPYASSHGTVGRLLEATRRLLRPIHKLFWNPDTLVWSLGRQSDVNGEIHGRYVHLLHILHNFAVEMTKLNLEVQDLKNRNLQLQGRLELLVRREKTLEDMVVYRDGGEPGATPAPPETGASPALEPAPAPDPAAGAASDRGPSAPEGRPEKA